MKLLAGTKKLLFIRHLRPSLFYSFRNANVMLLVGGGWWVVGWPQLVLRLFLCGLKLNAIKSELLKEMMDEVQLIRGMWY